MERHNRKSYLAPAAPKSLKDNTPSSNSSSAAATPSTSSSKPAPVSKSTRPQLQTATSGEVPLVNDTSSPARYYGASAHQSSNSRSGRSIQPPSLEHLSLETRDDSDARSGRHQARHHGDPVSAIDPPSRPFMSPRSISSHNSKTRTNLNPASMPMRAAVPPPSGPPPPPPVSAGNNYRGYPGTSS